jgi:hypothetical protein
MADIQTQWKFLADTDELASGMDRAKELSSDAAQAVSDGWNQAGTNAVEALKAVASESDETYTRSKEQIDKATGAAELLSDAIGIKIPGALQKMAAESEIAGPLLDAAFEPLAILAVAQAIVDVISKVEDLIESWRNLSDEEKGAIDAHVQSVRKAISFERQVIAIRRETLLVGKSEAEQARLRAQFAQEDLAEDKGYLKLATERYAAAKALLAEAAKGETKQVQSDYRNPRTGMRNTYNMPVISDEQVKQAQATIRDLEGIYGAGLQDLQNETFIADEKRILAEKQASQQVVTVKKQENVSLDDLEKTAAADVHEIQDRAQKEQLQSAVKSDLESLNEAKRQNEQIIKASQEKLEAAEIEMKGEVDAAKIKEQTEEQLIQQQFAKGQISKQQEIAALAAAKQKELQIEIDYYAGLARLNEGDEKAVARIEAEITKLKAQQELIRAKATTESITEQEKQYQNLANQIRRVFSGMEGVFSGFTRNILSGNKSIGQAWDKMVDDMATKFVEGLEKQLMAFLQKKVMEIAIHAQTEETKEAISKATTQKEDLRTAYSAAKNAWKATAGIDVVGPVLAPIAAAAAFAGVVSFGSAEGGQYYVPNNQLTMLHPQEMVLPAGIANQMRSVISGGGSGGGGATIIVNHSVNAVDAASFQQHIRTHSNMIANEVTRALKRKRA